VVLDLKTRRIVHASVTQYPTDEWTAQQLREATPWGRGPKYLIRDRDSKYAAHFSLWQPVLGSKNSRRRIACHPPNGVCERFMGSLRREYLDHMLIHDGRYLQLVVQEYTAYYNQERPIRGLVSIFPNSMLCQSQSQPADASSRGQSLVDCIIVMLVRQI
jgi:putative transposase